MTTIKSLEGLKKAMQEKVAEEKTAIKERKRANYNAQRRAHALKKARVKLLEKRRKEEVLDNGSRERVAINKLSFKMNIEREAQKWVSRELIEVQESTYLRKLSKGEESVTIDGYTKIYDNVSKEMLIVNLKSVAETSYIDEYFTEEVLFNRITGEAYVKSITKGHILPWKAPGNEREELKPLNLEELLEEKGMERYRVAFISPSQEKNTEATLIKWDGNEDRWEKRLDHITGGQYSLLKELHKGVSYEKLVKLSGYFANGLAPSTEIDYGVESIGMLFSKTRRAAADGGGFFLANEIFPVGTGAQMRSFKADKGFFLSIGDNSMDRLVRRYGPVIHIKEVTDEINKDLIRAHKGEGPYVGKMVVIGEKATPDFFMDLNIMKTEIDYRKIQSTVSVLDLSGMTYGKNKVTFGSQMAYSLLTNESGKELFKELMIEVVKSYIDDYKDNTPRVISKEELLKGIEYPAGLIEKINPYWGKNVDRGIKRSMEKNLANRISKTISNIKIEVDGIFGRVLADFGLEVGDSALKEDQIYSPDLEPGQKVLGIRSPKGGVREQVIYTNVPSEELVSNIEKMKVSEEDKELVFLLFASLRKGSGVIIISSSGDVKLVHSGMDHDFDGVTFIIDQRIVREAMKHKPLIVKVNDEGNANNKGKKKEEIELFDFSADAIGMVLKTQFNNGNLSVGIVCHHNHTWVSTLSDLKFARVILSYQFGRGENTEYIGLDYKPDDYGREKVEIDEDLTNKVLSEISNLDAFKADDASIKKALEDINVVMNRFIQKTIDASKSGEKIVIPTELLINEVVVAGSLKEIRLIPHESETEKAITVFRNEETGDSLQLRMPRFKTSYKKEGDNFLFSDYYNTIRKGVAKTAAKYLKEFIKETPKVDTETFLQRESIKFDKDMFLNFKYIFGNIDAFKRFLLKGSRSEAKALDIKKKFREINEYLTNTVRVSTQDMTPKDRVLAAMDVATNKKKGLYEAPSLFPSSTLALEYLLLVAEHKEGINFVGSPLQGINIGLQDGDEIRVINNAVAGEGFVDVEDGIYEVREFNGRLYATESIESVLTPLIETNDKFVVRFSGGIDFEEAKASIKEDILISTWRENRKSNSANDFSIDLPSGGSGYSEAIEGVIGKTDIVVNSYYIDQYGNKKESLFACFKQVGRKTPVKNKKKPLKKINLEGLL